MLHIFLPSQERNIGDSERYNSIITHETLRVAVIQQLEDPTVMPFDLLKVMQESFMEYYDHYVDICHKNMHKEGQTMNVSVQICVWKCW